MTWKLEYLSEAIADLASLDNSIRQPVIKGIKKFKRILFPKKKVDENKVYDEAGNRRLKHDL